MPTAGKLASALIFALLAFVLAATYRFDLPREAVPGSYYGVSAMIGLLVGWRVMGPRSEGRPMATANDGLLTAVITVLIALIYFATIEMLKRSVNELYSGPLEAVIGIFSIAGDYMARMASPRFIATLLLGGMLGGLLAGHVGRRWP